MTFNNFFKEKNLFFTYFVFFVMNKKLSLSIVSAHHLSVAPEMLHHKNDYMNNND